MLLLISHDATTSGFPKCGTSSLSNMLDSHPQLASLHGENYMNMINKTENLKTRLVHMQTQRQAKNNAGSITVGYKQSHDLYHPYITTRNYAHVFPTTPLIVTLRHPVKWFESYWNFRHNNNGKNWTLPFYPLKHVIQRRGDFRQGIWTDDLHVGLGMFHHYLAHLGKTPQRNGTREMELLSYEMKEGEAAEVFPVPNQVPNRVFVMLTEQLEDRESNDQVRRDLQSFLRLDTPFDEIPHVRPDTLYLSQKTVRKSKPETICKPKYKELREKLVRIGEIVSEWVLDYFLTRYAKECNCFVIATHPVCSQ